MRYGRSLALLILDVDHLKEINTSLGQPAGDQVLTGIANLAVAMLRTHDVVGRLGDDEFGLILPEAGSQQAGLVAERMRSRVEGLIFDEGALHPRQATISIGIAILQSTEESADSMARRAARAVARAKEEGRNRCVVEGG